eukprot:gnl/TRDRNA2_/TRDRNA2_176012_c6_seq1.p1 gnl/TRDRNA2_/TRDRNA2_176012_c6~~gnl/TRDRNA2_/TRDRNA2_176012_c6_seq1.p1  ORF type:complete len:779 (-),score=120.37 gnl/TRDRNA2_/TRDRNA2_176012_c6_seq1:114-2429(-)
MPRKRQGPTPAEGIAWSTLQKIQQLASQSLYGQLSAEDDSPLISRCSNSLLTAKALRIVAPETQDEEEEANNEVSAGPIPESVGVLRPHVEKQIQWGMISIPADATSSTAAADPMKAHRLAMEVAKQTISPMPPSQYVDGVIHPLSYNEEHMLRLFVGNPHDIGYNVPNGSKSILPVDSHLVHRVFKVLMERHDCLRSVWNYDDPNRPVRHLLPFEKLKVEEPIIYQGSEQMLTELHLPAFLFRLHQLGECSVRFSTWPGTFQGQADHCWYGINMHHIVADADAMQLTMRELHSATAALASGYSEEVVAKDMLPELPIQFVDYAYWHRALDHECFLVGDMAVWYNHLSASCPGVVLDMPMDFPRPRVYVAQGDAVRMRFDVELVNPIIQGNVATQFSGVVSLYAIALARIMGSKVYQIAVPFGAKMLPQFNNLIGNFLNMLPCRFNYDTTMAFGETFQRFNKVVVDVQRHGLAPFISLTSVVAPHYPTYDPSRNPMYQTMVDMVPGDGTLNPSQGLRGVLDFFLFANTWNTHLHSVDGSYNSGVYDKSTAQRVIMCLAALSLDAARDKTVPLNEYLSSREAASCVRKNVMAYLMMKQNGLPYVVEMRCDSGMSLQIAGIDEDTPGYDGLQIRACQRFERQSALQFGAQDVSVRVCDRQGKKAKKVRRLGPPGGTAVPKSIAGDSKWTVIDRAYHEGDDLSISGINCTLEEAIWYAESDPDCIGFTYDSTDDEPVVWFHSKILESDCVVGDDGNFQLYVNDERYAETQLKKM